MILNISGRAQNLVNRLIYWRLKNLNDKQFIYLLSIITGLLAGIMAILIKNTVHLIQFLLKFHFSENLQNFLLLLYPVTGIFLVVIFLRYIFRNRTEHEIPDVLYAISRNKGKMKPSNIYTTTITSVLTVGFGGSAGLEGPSVTTGSSIGSTLSQLLRLSHKHTILLISCASAAAISSLFKAPIAGVVFAVEIFMLDLTMASIVPLLISSSVGALLSYFFYSQDVIYDFQLIQQFNVKNIPFYILLGILTGLLALYFTTILTDFRKMFETIKTWYYKIIIGGLILGLLIFLMPSLYGEGYLHVNSCLKGDFGFIFEHSPFYSFRNNYYAVLIMFLFVILLKPVATAITFGAGGVGGIFAPVLFLGANVGFFFSKFVEMMGFKIPASNFALVGMAGLLAGVMYAPLTGIFLIAEITNGYELIIPLMIVSTISYAINRSFNPHSIYTRQLYDSGDLFTHNKDKTVLSMMKVESYIEKNFLVVSPEQTLRDLTNVISRSQRNIYPVIDKNGGFLGIIFFDHIKHMIFRTELYDKILVKDLSFMPSVVVSLNDSMEKVVEKFNSSGNFNLPVIDNDKYIGFLSRANILTEYRKRLNYFSEE